MRVLFAAAIACLTALAHAQEAPPVSAFANPPDMDQATISPDGRHVAYFTQIDGAPALAVTNLEQMSSDTLDISTVRPGEIRWASDTVVLMTGSELRNIGGVRGGVDVSAVFSVDLADGFEARQLLRRDQRVRFAVGNRIIGVDWERGRVLIPAFADQRRYSLFAVDPTTDNAVIEQRGDPSGGAWFVDETGAAAARVSYSNDRNRQRVVAFNDGQPREVFDEGDAELPFFSGVGLLADGRLGVTISILGGADEEDRTRGLYALSLETGELEGEVWAHPDYDIVGLRTDPYSNLIIGASYGDETSMRVHWLDAEIAEAQTALNANFDADGPTPRILNWTRDRTRFIALYEEPASPPLYLIFDRDTGRVSLLGQARAALPTGQLPQRISISYPARDGTMIPAMLTRPATPGPHPTVIMPHGGPAARDYPGFDYMAHFLATRGYAVLQPNFRGSDGYGQAWELAGWGQWGEDGVMLTDVTDGALALIRAQVAQPGQICIAGASYGGYAALSGAIHMPDLYACAIAIAPITDLPAMLEYDRDRFGDRSWITRYWELSYAGEDERARNSLLRDLSPSRMADRINAPVLLIHGRDDSVVPLQQSETMRNALRREDADVELIDIVGGDHWLSYAETRVVVLEAMEAFLAEHIGGGE